MSTTKIVLNRQSDLILDNALITSPSGITINDIAELSATLSTEESSRISGDVSLDSSLSSETSSRISGDTVTFVIAPLVNTKLVVYGDRV